MRFRLGVIVGVSTAAALMAACGGGGKSGGSTRASSADPGPPTTALFSGKPASTYSGAKACALVTVGDLVAAFGGTYGVPEADEEESASGYSKCSINGTSGPVALVTVAVTNSQGALDAFDQAHAVSSGLATDSKKVDGVGDKAVWEGRSSASGNISFVAKGHVVTLGVVSSGPPAVDVATTLAKIAVAHL